MSVLVNTKSISASFGGNGPRYPVSIKGRRTTTGRILGMPMSLQHVSGAPRSAPSRRTAIRQIAQPRQMPKPGLSALKGEKRPYEILARPGPGATVAAGAVSCEQLAAEFSDQQIAALRLAGLFALGDDRHMAIRTLGEVFSSRVEIANYKSLHRHASWQEI